MRNKQVVVIGASDTKENLQESYTIGKFIAQKEYTLITGGRGGIMEAASRGAFENQGTVIGILPGDDFSGANSFCTVVIPTGIGFARNVINVISADIIVAIGGKSGTLSELTYAWQFRKPILCCTFAHGWSSEFPGTKIDDRKGSEILTAATVDQACSLLENYLDGLSL